MLSKNHTLLKEEYGIFYPETGRKRNAHHRLAHSLFYSDPVTAKPWENLKNKLNQDSDWETTVISTESLDRAAENHIRLLYESLTGEWTIKAICYLRSPDEFLESSFSGKVIKGAYSGSWKEFRDDAVKNNYPNYTEIIRRWKNVLGENSVIVRPYDKKMWRSGNLFADFFETLGYPGAESHQSFFLPGRINTRSGIINLSITREIVRRLEASEIPYTAKYIKKSVSQKALEYDDGNPARFFTHQERVDIRNLSASEFQELGIKFSQPVESPEDVIHSELPEIEELPNVGEKALQEIFESIVEILQMNREDILHASTVKKARRMADKKLQGK